MKAILRYVITASVMAAGLRAADQAESGPANEVPDNPAAPAKAAMEFRIVDPEKNPFSKDPRRDLSVNIGGGKGVVIAPHWVLTASHCISSKRGDTVGMTYVNEDGKRVTITSDKVIRHGATDFALVRFKAAIEGRKPLLLLKDGFPVSRKGQPPYQLAKVAGNGVWEEIPARVSQKSGGERFYITKERREGKAGTSGGPWVIHSPLVGDVLVGVTHGTGRVPQVGRVCQWIEQTVNSLGEDRIIWATPAQAMAKQTQPDKPEHGDGTTPESTENSPK
ncbi:MAG: trypsin-like serine protease [Verrucomicrobia bacterium]|nr:trypsin-like serine protease [Verrucomicrobiota bacterium]